MPAKVFELLWKGIKMKKYFWTILTFGIVFTAFIYYWQSRSAAVDIKEIAPQELRQMIESDNDFFVYFYSPACKECIKSASDLVKAINETKIKIVKLDLKKYPGAKKEWQIPGTPSLYYFDNHKLVKGISGASTEQEYIKFFREQSIK